MATQLAQAYVQIIPSAEGIQGKLTQALNPQMEDVGATAGKTLSAGLLGAVIAGAAAVGVALKKGIEEGAALEQSIGGIETMFKDQADTMVKYANEAYKTAGVSANTYMEQATSFSASLLQSLGGDTEKAAELANQAIIDMSDNSAKFGSNIEDIQNAFMGFSKQNFTMLDNLKLGYGGTKTEMERLLADAEKLSGVEYNIDNLADVYTAIHVIQGELGVTGTTALEAGETFSGSFAMMQGALSNFLATMTLGDQATMSLQTALGNLVTATITFLTNAIPMIGNFLISIPPALFGLLESVNFVEIQKFIAQAFTHLTTFITSHLPEMIINGINAISSFIMGMIESIPALLDSAAEMIENLGSGMESNFGRIIQVGLSAVLKLVAGLIRNLPQIIAAAGKLMITLAKALLASIPSIVSIGWDIVRGIWRGISNGLGWIKNKIRGWVGNVLAFIKNLFGINSPSKVMNKEVGVFLAQGLGVGFENEMKSVQKDMGKAIPTSFNVAPTLNANRNNAVPTQMIHNVITLDGRVIAEETFPYTDRLLGRKLTLAKGGIL